MNMNPSEIEAIMSEKYPFSAARPIRIKPSHKRSERRQSLLSKIIQRLNPMSIVQDLYDEARMKRDQAVAINSSRRKITSL